MEHSYKEWKASNASRNRILSIYRDPRAAEWITPMARGVLHCYDEISPQALRYAIVGTRMITVGVWVTSCISICLGYLPRRPLAR